MNCRITLLYSKGVRLPASRKAVTLDGDMGLGRIRHTVLGRDVTHASLIATDEGQHRQVAELIDAQLVEIGAKGMRFRGFEVSSTGVEVAQEWYVTPM